jgi:hypothetical protein
VRCRALVTATALIVALLASASAHAATCAYPSVYPGDSAPKAQLAAWMAGGAVQAGIPGELPVMAALVESDLQNLPQGDSTTAGFFQMRVDIWNSGDYSGFPDHPTLQLQWFIDQAQNVRKQNYAQGNTAYGQDESTWGAWAADVQRPPQQYRYRYQLKLDEARQLIASYCGAPADTGTPPPAGSPPPAPSDPAAQMIPDSVLPTLAVNARRFQNPARTGSLVLTSACTNEDCLLRAAGAVAVPDHGVFRMLLAPQQVEQGKATSFSLPLTKRQRRLVAAAARSGTCALGVIRVVAANDGGWRRSASRTVYLGPRRLCAG